MALITVYLDDLIKKLQELPMLGKALKNLCSSLRKIETRKLLTKPKAEKKQRSKSLRLKIFQFFLGKNFCLEYWNEKENLQINAKEITFLREWLVINSPEGKIHGNSL